MISAAMPEIIIQSTFSSTESVIFTEMNYPIHFSGLYIFVGDGNTERFIEGPTPMFVPSTMILW